MLDPKSYRDINNYVRKNQLSFNTNRWQLIETPREYNYVDVVQMPPWIGTISTWNVKSSRDGGKTFYDEK
jgi:hypothetical protein